MNDLDRSTELQEFLRQHKWHNAQIIALKTDASQRRYYRLSQHERSVILMLKNEEANIEQIRDVYEFLKTDEFWKSNVQSVPKLREKFTTIYTQSKKPKNESSSKGTGGASDEFKRRIFETLTGQSSN